MLAKGVLGSHWLLLLWNGLSVFTRQSLGKYPLRNILLNNEWRGVMINDDEAFTISLMIPSMPAALLTFKLAVAAWTSASLILKFSSLNILFLLFSIKSVKCPSNTLSCFVLVLKSSVKCLTHSSGAIGLILCFLSSSFSLEYKFQNDFGSDSLMLLSLSHMYFSWLFLQDFIYFLYSFFNL